MFSKQFINEEHGFANLAWIFLLGRPFIWHSSCILPHPHVCLQAPINLSLRLTLPSC